MTSCISAPRNKCRSPRKFTTVLCRTSIRLRGERSTASPVSNLSISQPTAAKVGAMSPMRLLRFHDGGSQDRMGYPQVVHFRLSLANCYFTRDSSGFPALLRFFDAQSGRSFHPFHRRPGSVARSWRGPFPRCGVASAQAPDPDLESLPETISEFTRVGPGPRWLDGALVRPTRLLRSAIVLKPSTLLGLHKALSKQKYRMLFCPNRRLKPGPKGPRAELIRAVVEMKQRNPNWGCPRIAQQIALAFHIQINKDVVRRILGHHYQPGHSSGGPSWLTFLGHMKDSLWSMDLFRCESATLRTHWVLVVMDQYTRRIIGFGVHAGAVDGVTLCRMFNRAI